MKWKLRELQGRVQAQTGERVTYEDMMTATGLAKQTITNLSTGRAQRLDISTMEKLLDFFATRLGEPLTTSDLLEYRPE